MIYSLIKSNVGVNINMDTENNSDLQEIPLEIHEDDEKALSDVQAGDSYDELAKDAQVVTEPPPPKRGRGRPLGSKNKKKVAEPEAVSEEESASEEPATPQVPRRRKARAAGTCGAERAPMVPALDVKFDEGYGGAGPPKKPVRTKRPPAAVSLMKIIAQAASQHGERERDRRRSFYENYLPM